MDVYYLPNGEKIDTMSAKTLFEHDNDSYNGFYSVTVQDEDGQVYSETALRDLPAIDFVATQKLHASAFAHFHGAAHMHEVLLLEVEK